MMTRVFGLGCLMVFFFGGWVKECLMVGLLKPVPFWKLIQNFRIALVLMAVIILVNGIIVSEKCMYSAPPLCHT